MRSLAQNPLPGILQFPKPASPEDSGRRHAVLATDPFPHEYPIHALSGILRQTSRETRRARSDVDVHDERILFTVWCVVDELRSPALPWQRGTALASWRSWMRLRASV